MISLRLRQSAADSRAVQIRTSSHSFWDGWHFSGLDLLEASDEAAIVMDAGGTVVYCNAATERLQGRQRSQIIGRPIEQLSVADVPVGPTGPSWTVLMAGEHWSGDIWVIRSDGSEVPVHVTRSPLFDDKGAVVGVLSLAADRTREHAAKLALVASERRFRALAQRSSDLAILLRPDGTITYVSPSVQAISGLEAASLIGANCWDFVHPDDVANLADSVARLTDESTLTGEWRFLTSSGWRWFEMTLTDMQDDDAVGGIVGNIRDVTERRHALEAMRTLAERFRRVFDESPVGKMIVDTNLRIVEANQTLCESLGYEPGGLHGVCIDDLVSPLQAEEQRASWARLFAGEVESLRLDLAYRRHDGSEVVARLKASALHDEAGLASTCICEVEDVTEQVRAGEELAWRALSDPLTHLPNRVLLQDRLSQALGRLSREAGIVAVLFLDVDRLKFVNDTLGHDAGDELLIEVAARLSRSVRATDTVARFGGDEFVVVAEDVFDAATAVALGRHLIDAVAAPLEAGGRAMSPSVSVGIALTSDPLAEPTALVRQADLAMYQAKDQGGMRCSVYVEEDDPLDEAMLSG